MDCKTARLLLEFARPLSAELDTDDAEGLREHLADCPECGPLYRADRQADEHLGQAVRAVPVPEHLQSRLLEQLGQERRVWYRRRVWIPGAAAAAALILLAVLLGVGGRTPPTAFNLDNVYHAVTTRVGVPPEQVEEWFQTTYHLRTTAPTGFDYSYLTFFDLAEFQGKRVPMLLFVRGQDIARVFILSEKEFNLDAEPAPGYPVALLRPAGSAVAYVVIYTNNENKALDWFLLKQTEPAA